jgi:hypothetical protein
VVGPQRITSAPLIGDKGRALSPCRQPSHGHGGAGQRCRTGALDHRSRPPVAPGDKSRTGRPGQAAAAAHSQDRRAEVPPLYRCRTCSAWARERQWSPVCSALDPGNGPQRIEGRKGMRRRSSRCRVRFSGVVIPAAILRSSPITLTAGADPRTSPTRRGRSISL